MRGFTYMVYQVYVLLLQLQLTPPLSANLHILCLSCSLKTEKEQKQVLFQWCLHSRPHCTGTISQRSVYKNKVPAGCYLYTGRIMQNNNLHTLQQNISRLTNSVFGAIAVEIKWQLDIPTNVISTYTHQRCEFEYGSDDVFSIQHYVIKSVSNLWQVDVFLRVLRVSAKNKTDHHGIIEILLKLALNTICPIPIECCKLSALSNK